MGTTSVIISVKCLLIDLLIILAEGLRVFAFFMLTLMQGGVACVVGKTDDIRVCLLTGGRHHRWRRSVIEVSVELQTVVLIHQDTVLIELSLTMVQERLVWVVNFAFLFLVTASVGDRGLQVVDFGCWDADGILVDGADRELLENLGFELATNLRN